MSTDKKNIISPVATLSYPHLAEPQALTAAEVAAQKKAKYSGAFLFAPGVDMRPLEAAALAAAEEKWPGKGGDLLRLAMRDSGATKFRSPFRRDVEEKGYKDVACFINARTENKPACVYIWPGPDGKKPAEIPAEKIKTDLYAGAQVKVSLRAFAYDTNGNKGVSFALGNVQKIGEGKRLDNRVAAVDEFDADLSSAPDSIADLV